MTPDEIPDRPNEIPEPTPNENPPLPESEEPISPDTPEPEPADIPEPEPVKEPEKPQGYGTAKCQFMVFDNASSIISPRILFPLTFTKGLKTTIPALPGTTAMV